MFNIYFKEMKKFFSLIALVGIIAACTPEQLGTAFKLAGAKGTINVEVLNLDGTPYAGTFTLSGYENLPGVEAPVVTGNTATINFQLGDSQAIESVIDLTLTANGPLIYRPASAKVRIPKVLAGGVAELACTIKVGENVDGWFVYEDYDFPDVDNYRVGYLVNTHGYSVYEHSVTIPVNWLDIEIPSWYVNNSDQILTGNVDIPYAIGYELDSIETNDWAGFDLTLKGCVNAWRDDWEEEEVVEGEAPYTFNVSGWAMWNVFVVQDVYPLELYLNAIKLDDNAELTDEEIELATATVNYYVTWAGAVEMAYPGMPGHAHYEYKHGHGHGGDNAGGGISFNE